MSKKYIIVIGVIISLAGCSQSTVKPESEDIIPPFPKEEAQRPYSPLESKKNPFPKSSINTLPNCSSFRNAVNKTTLTVETGERLTELSRCQRERNTCSGKCILTRRCSQVLACLGQ